MLWTIALILTMLWLLGLMAGDAMGYFIHIPLFIAVIAMLIKIEADCSNYCVDHMRKRCFKRQLVAGSEKIVSKLATLSEEKIFQPIISPPTYKKE